MNVQRYGTVSVGQVDVGVVSVLHQRVDDVVRREHVLRRSASELQRQVQSRQTPSVLTVDIGAVSQQGRDGLGQIVFYALV